MEGRVITMNKLNDELLYEINNIDSVIHESEYEVLTGMYDYYNKMMSFMECSSDFEESLSIIMEADANPGLLHNLGSGLKKLAKTVIDIFLGIFRKMGNFLGQITDFFRGLMGKDAKHAPKKTISQILEENNNIVPRQDIDMTKFRKKKVSMPLDPSSEESVPTVNMYTSALVTEINDDGTYTMKTSKLFKDMVKFYMGDKGKVTSQIPGYTQATPLSIMMFKNYEGCFDHVKNAINILEAMFNNKISVAEYEKKFISQVNYIENLGRKKSLSNLTIKFTLEEMMTFQKEIAELASHLSSEAGLIKKSEEDPNFKFSPDMITAVNFLTASMMYVQVNLNAYSLSLNNIYVIPEEYSATINDFDLMGEFVNSMIMAGIPSKYIMLNAWLAGTREFTGNPGTYNEEKAGKYKPAMGHCRGCFFPESLKTSVYKIALNKRGTHDIENEFWVTNRVKGTPLETKFAIIKKTNKYNTICEMEKIKTLEASDTFKYAGETDKIIKQMDELFGFVIHDLHTLNFGIRIAPEPSLPGSKANELIISDYGALRFKDTGGKTKQPEETGDVENE